MNYASFRDNEIRLKQKPNVVVVTNVNKRFLILYFSATQCNSNPDKCRSLRVGYLRSINSAQRDLLPVDAILIIFVLIT